MKVYARHIKKEGFEYRLDTLLQFGNSWDLIGSVVLANPGSSNPIGNIEKDLFEKIDIFFRKYRKGVSIANDEWFEFSPDSTMRQIAKMFDGSYINKEKQLNGVIQLFNCFNIKNQNLDEAISQITFSDKKLALTSEDIQSFFSERPVYFGFSKSLLDNKELEEIAKKIFDKAEKKEKQIFNANFLDNDFYHPGYINRAYSTNKKVQDILNKLFLSL